MDAYAVVKYAHVLLAIVAVGANATYGVWIGRAQRDPATLPFVLRGVKFLDDFVANPAYVLRAASGLVMVLGLGVPWALWNQLGLALWALALGLGYGDYTPTLRRQIRALEQAGPASGEFKRLSLRGTIVGIMLVVIVLGIVWLMVAKPTA